MGRITTRGSPGGPPDKWTLALFRTTVSTKGLRRGNNWRESKQRPESASALRPADGWAGAAAGPAPGPRPGSPPPPRLPSRPGAGGGGDSGLRRPRPGLLKGRPASAAPDSSHPGSRALFRWLRPDQILLERPLGEPHAVTFIVVDALISIAPQGRQRLREGK